MGTPPLSEAVLQRAVDAWLEADRSVMGAAAALGMNRSKYKYQLEQAKRAGLHLSTGARHSVTTAGLDGVDARGGHRRVYDDAGRQIDTVRWSAPVATEDPVDMAASFRAAFDGLVPAQEVTPPAQVMDDLCSVYPLMDAHVGMHAWGRETGDVDYDVRLAMQDMRHAFAKVLAITPASSEAVLIIGGDFFHADDNRNETPANRHKLDSDGRFDKVAFSGVTVLTETIEQLLRKHQTVHVSVLRGNHDENSHRIIKVGLWAWYQNNPRVTVADTPRDLFMMQWGKCAIFSHHGDKGKPQQMALYLSDICPFWSATRHRHYLTGHVHHDQAKDVGPLRWESLRAFCPPDAYAAGMGYGARRALQSLTFHKQDGLVLRAMDPIDRMPE